MKWNVSSCRRSPETPQLRTPSKAFVSTTTASVSLYALLADTLGHELLADMQIVGL